MSSFGDYVGLIFGDPGKHGDRNIPGKFCLLAAVALILALFNYVTFHIDFLRVYRLRPQVAILMLSGYLAGPYAGFFTGFVSAMAGDYFMGAGSPVYALSLSVGDGVMCSAMGLIGRRARYFKRPEDISVLYLAMLAAIFIGAVSSETVYMIFPNMDFTTESMTKGEPLFIADYLVSAALIPWFLYSTNRIRKTIVQRMTLLLYYSSFTLAIGSVSLVLFFLSSRMKLLDTIVNPQIYMYDILIIPILAINAGGYALSGIITKRVVKPLVVLTGEIRRIYEGGFTERIKLDFGEDLSELSGAFNEMTDRLAGYTDEICRIAGEKERIETELLLASRIQRMMLPDGRDEAETVGCRVYGKMIPMREIGGDFFNYFPIDNNRLFFVAADVSGHGAPAALFMMAAHSTLSSLVYSEPDIERVFTALNNRLCEKNEEGYFVTAFAGVFCADSKRLIYVNAGHNPPFIKSGESFSQLPCKVNLILGAIKDVEYRAEEILTQSGDILCVYTDGVTEASNPNLEMYSAKRLERTLDDNKNASPKNIAEHVFTDVTNFTGDAEPSDDLTLLCIKFL